jgi:hypothetical protein
MTEFAEALSAALHERARETAMSIDMHQAERQLQESIRSADRRRRVWIAVAAAAAVLVAVAGVLLGIKVPTTQPAHPTPTASQPSAASVTFYATSLSPVPVAQLPPWVASFAHAASTGYYSGGWELGQQNGSRAIGLYSVGYMYPLGATRIAHPSYAELVADWKAVQTRGYGTVSDVATTIVGGKPATTMTVTITRQAAGFAFCEASYDARTNTSACAGVYPGRVMHLAIVNQGTAHSPTLLWESSTTDDTASPSVASEFATWLATVRFH